MLAPRTPDQAAAILGGNVSPPEAAALHHAALRELREEIGLDLDGPASLVPIARWTTPAFMHRRFATWFFVADLPSDVELVFEADEVAGHAWLTPSRAFEERLAGSIEMWVPTTSVLERLLETGASSAAQVAARLGIGRDAPPRIVDERDDVVRLAFGVAGALPGRPVVTSVVGRRELVVVDPGDPSEAAIRAIEAVAERRGATFRAIVLTSTDPDHAAGAEALAIPHRLPILIAPGTGRRLPYETLEIADGDRLPADVPLRVRLAPGGDRLEIEPVVAGSAGE
jgi:ADP-ribose pyrophosphatase YjhB (NUDIX family)